MNVRRADISDIGSLIEILKVMGEESPVYNRFVPDYPKQYRTLLNLLMSPDALVLMLDDKTGLLIGHMEDTMWFEGSYGWEDIIFVLPAFRKTARASALVKAFEDWARERSAIEIRLGLTTEVEVESSFNFFERLGYTPSGAFFRKGV
jgi:GNAT superfamily N-acetyltransferase